MSLEPVTESITESLTELTTSSVSKPVSESVLDEDTWPQEVQAAINDIKKHVKSAHVSKVLKNNNLCCYFNLTTLEDSSFCIEMSAAGFRIVGKDYDSISIEGGTTFETPYALLNAISKKYRQSFGGELMSKLMELAKKEG